VYLQLSCYNYHYYAHMSGAWWGHSADHWWNDGDRGESPDTTERRKWNLQHRPDHTTPRTSQHVNRNTSSQYDNQYDASANVNRSATAKALQQQDAGIIHNRQGVPGRIHPRTQRFEPIGSGYQQWAHTPQPRAAIGAPSSHNRARSPHNSDNDAQWNRHSASARSSHAHDNEGTEDSDAPWNRGNPWTHMYPKPGATTARSSHAHDNEGEGETMTISTGRFNFTEVTSDDEINDDNNFTNHVKRIRGAATTGLPWTTQAPHYPAAAPEDSQRQDEGPSSSDGRDPEDVYYGIDRNDWPLNEAKVKDSERRRRLIDSHAHDIRTSADGSTDYDTNQMKELLDVTVPQQPATHDNSKGTQTLVVLNHGSHSGSRTPGAATRDKRKAQDAFGTPAQVIFVQEFDPLLYLGRKIDKTNRDGVSYGMDTHHIAHDEDTSLATIAAKVLFRTSLSSTLLVLMTHRARKR